MSSKKVMTASLLAGALFLVVLVASFLFDGGSAPAPTEESANRSAATVESSAAEPGAAEPSGEAASNPGSAEATPEADASENMGDEEAGPVLLEGRVTDGDGEGIAEATVLALNERRWKGILAKESQQFDRNPFAAFRHFRKQYSRAAEKVPRAKTDKDGWYRFRGLQEGEHRVLVSDPRYLPSKDAWAFIEEGRVARCDLTLVEGHAIKGRVVDKEGKGVAGALLRASPSEEAEVRGIGRMLQAFVRLAGADILVRSRDIVTGGDGSFTAGALEPVLHDLRVRKPGYAPGLSRKIPAGTEGVVLILERGLTVSGRIVDSRGIPVPGASVELGEPQMDPSRLRSPALIQDLGDFLGENTLSATSKEDGTFQLLGAQAGALELRVEASSFPELRRAVDVGARTAQLGDVVLAEGYAITGAVMSAAGVPVEGARVMVLEPGRQAGPFSQEKRIAEAATETDGSFVLPGLAEGKYDLKALEDELGEVTLRSVPAGTENLTLQLKPGFVLQGRVLEEKTRLPVPGAEVRVLGAASRTVVTDENGAFRVAGVPQDRTGPLQSNLLLRVKHPGYQTTTARAQAGDKTPLEILLGPAAGVQGIVVDSGGGAVGGARVWLEVPGIPSGLFLMSPQDAPESVYSASDGTFFVPLPRQTGSFTLEIVAFRPGVGRARYGPITAAEGEPVHLVLEPGFRLAGRVTDTEGNLVERARVVVSRQVEVPPELRMMRSMLPRKKDHTAYTRKDGSYELAELETGTYRMELSARGYATKVIEEIQLSANELQWNVVVDAGQRIEGRVVDPEGLPLEGIEVIAFLELAAEGNARQQAMQRMADQLQGASGSGVAAARTDAEGGYALEHLPDGTFRVVARAPGYELEEVREVAGGGRIPDIVLSPFAWVSGSVRDAGTGAPVTSFDVELRLADTSAPENRTIFNLPRGTYRDDEGLFLMDNVPARKYQIMVSAKSYAPYRQVVDLQPGRETSVAVVLSQGSTVTGRAATPEGNPISGVRVGVAGSVANRDPQGGSSYFRREATTKDDGSFEIAGVPEGEYRIRFSNDNYYLEKQPQRLNVSADTPGPFNFEVTLLPAGRVTGRVSGRSMGDDVFWRLEFSLVEPAGAPPAGAGEKPSRKGSSRRFSTWIDQRSRGYALGGLPPGTYSVELREQARQRTPGEDRKEVRQELGSVEIRAGEASRFDAVIPER